MNDTNEPEVVKSSKLSKRAKLLEEKLKNKKVSSLFDTDGDLSKHNIIESGKRTRFRSSSSESSSSSPKTTRRKKTMPMYKNAKEKLLSKKKTDTLKNEWISTRLDRMATIQQEHDASVKELYHLELFQNMLDYNPTSFINDIRYHQYVQDYDIWESLRKNTTITSTIRDPTLIDLLQSAIYESTHTSYNHGPSFHTIHSGTGLRRQHRQFATLQDYMTSFYTADEDDITPEARETYIQKEADIRQRLAALAEKGGFTPKNVKTIAHRKPEQPQQQRQLHHDQLLVDMAVMAKQIQNTQRYKRAAARKCARAIDKYWENIRTHDQRAERDETKRVQRMAKNVANQVKRKWKLIERICEARWKEVQKEKQAEEGRRHLELILEHSEHVLGKRKLEWQSVTSEEDEFHDDEGEESEGDHRIESDEESSDDEDAIRRLEEDQNLSVEELMAKYQAVEQSPSPRAEDEEEFATFSEEDVPIEEDGETEDDDEELNALQDDANLTVEELMQKYNNMSRKRSPSVGEDDHAVKRVKLEKTFEESDDDAPETTATSALVSNSKAHIPVPFLLRGQLREYQRIGLDWLASLYNNDLNGILADEMGLGKTIQTISLLAYLACEKGMWGPHLVVVPTSVILNWEMEFKKWLPGFKIMTYYGSPKERKEKRTGWSKENAFHVCITSYQLVLQDQSAFRRKQWHYLILDEAHNIKNFRSQRWQVLLNFNAKRRLLLTGTPLQNNLMELWSLLYFLMPNGVSHDMPMGFANLKEFQEWFSNPVDRMIENHDVYGMDEESRNAIQKLHTVLRPYLLRRLKADVEKQMPEKHEHVVYCRLSKRQRFLYDDFMSRAKTKETLASGNFLNIINCLMQLRKVCNHPDLFEERPILTSFAMVDDVQYHGHMLERLLRKRLGSDRDKLDLEFLNLVFTNPVVGSQAVADETMRLEASKAMIKSIARYEREIYIAESRGVTSRDYHDLRKYAKYREMQAHVRTVEKWNMISYVNVYRCAKRPVYDIGLIELVSPLSPPYMFTHDPRQYLDNCESIYHAVQKYKQRMELNRDLIEEFGFVTPKVVIRQDANHCHPLLRLNDLARQQMMKATNVENDIFHTAASRLSIAFPDKRLLQYDCGKLQKLDALLKDLAAGGHRALIFTQMTRVLDILETFLNMHGHRYLRLDGATKVEQRQVLTEYFNNDKRILCFILSTRSGGLGINLTGADTVIFYDSDWNPSMDKQCQDRAHRIGQTRDVHIYRFVTEYTIEENIFKKANQKRMLDNVVIQEGEFTQDYFQKNEWWKDLPEVSSSSAIQNMDYEQALLEAEDESDAAAAIAARKEMNIDDNEFEDSTPKRQMSEASSRPMSPFTPPVMSNTESPGQQSEEEEEEEEEEGDMQLDVGHVDQYMLQFWEREVVGTDLGFGGFSS